MLELLRVSIPRIWNHSRTVWTVWHGLDIRLLDGVNVSKTNIGVVQGELASIRLFPISISSLIFGSAMTFVDQQATLWRGGAHERNLDPPSSCTFLI